MVNSVVAKAYSQTSQTFEFIAKTLTKSSILDIWLGSEYASELS